MRQILMLLPTLILITACQNKKEMMVYGRDPAYFAGLTNSSAQSASAAQNLTQLKMIETGTDYPMRYVLFDNNTVYYQIDRLGNGYGFWNFQDGGIKITATRPMFDMILYVSGRAETGDDLVVRFVDRHGFNTINAQPRKPVEDGEGLPEFTENDKGL